MEKMLVEKPKINREKTIQPKFDEDRMKRLVIREMSNESSSFSPDIQSIITKIKTNCEVLPDEWSVFHRARDKWWEEKYGFPYYLKSARVQVISEKYCTKKEAKTAKTLQEKLFDASAGGNEADIESLKKIYADEFPEQLEGVEVVFGFRDALLIEMDLDAGKYRDKPKEELKKAYQQLTEYQFLFTHFVIQNPVDRWFMEAFWQVIEKIAGEIDGLKQLQILKAGILTQAAAYHILHAINGSSKLSHPREDAFESIDMWLNDDEAVQVKGGIHFKEPALLDSEHLAFPAIGISETWSPEDKRKKKFQYFNSAEYMAGVNERFMVKVDEYGKSTGREIKGHLLVIPRKMIDSITGEPKPELVEFFRKELKKTEKEA